MPTYKLEDIYCKPIPDFDALLAKHPFIPAWMDTDLNLDEYLKLCKRIKAGLAGYSGRNTFKQMAF